MKIYIGPYKDYYSVHSFLYYLEKIGVSEDRIVSIYSKFKHTWLCNKLDSILEIFNRDRKIKIRIDNYDVWNMDHTLSHIILPMLIKLRDSNIGMINVSDEDVPEEYRSYNCAYNEYGSDNLLDDRHEWLMNELIWTFKSINMKNIDDTVDEIRLQNGLRLFGKYYLHLWN